MFPTGHKKSLLDKVKGPPSPVSCFLQCSTRCHWGALAREGLHHIRTAWIDHTCMVNLNRKGDSSDYCQSNPLLKGIIFQHQASSAIGADLVYGTEYIIGTRFISGCMFNNPMVLLRPLLQDYFVFIVLLDFIMFNLMEAALGVLFVKCRVYLF